MHGLTRGVQVEKADHMIHGSCYNDWYPYKGNTVHTAVKIPEKLK